MAHTQQKHQSDVCIAQSVRAAIMSSLAPSPEDDCSDASSTTSEYSSVTELPVDGVPLQYPVKTGVVPPGTVYGQVSFPPPLATQAFPVTPPPPPVVYPVVTQSTQMPQLSSHDNNRDMQTGETPDAVYIPVVIPRLPLDTLKHKVDLPSQRQHMDKITNDGTKFLPEFQAKTVRIAFLRKVLWIVVLQLAIASSLAAATLFLDTPQEFVKENPWLVWISWGLGFGLLIFGSLAFEFIRKPLWSLLYLVVLTGALAAMICTLVGRFESDVLFLTVILTFSLMLILASIATVATVDVTNWVPLLMSSFVIVFGASVVGALYLDAVFHIVIAAAGAMIFSMFVVYDVQLLLGNSQKSLLPNEYITGSSSVYLDIIELFTSFFRIFKLSSR